MTEVCRAMASVTSAGPTSRGRAARRAGQSTPWKPALAAVQTKRGHTAGRGRAALTARPATALAMATWVSTSTRRRSQASARVPPQSEPARRGPSWASPSKPTTRVERVIW